MTMQSMKVTTDQTSAYCNTQHRAATDTYFRLLLLLPAQQTNACLQVIPYMSELLAKVQEQQAQATRIVGFQGLFKCALTPCIAGLMWLCILSPFASDAKVIVCRMRQMICKA